MPAERYYSDTTFSPRSTLSLENQEFHHLVNVMRTKVGEEIELVNGRGQLAKGTVAAIEKRKAHVDLVEVQNSQPPSHNLILAQAIPRINRLETILEKATELGATEIWLYATALSERKNFTDHQVERITAITIAAMKQCGRLYLPKIVIANSLKNLPPFPTTSFFGDITTHNPPKLVNAWKPNMKDLGIFIGPESGFTDEEEAFLKSKGAIGVNLHPNILRTDTAAIASLSLLSHLLEG